MNRLTGQKPHDSWGISIILFFWAWITYHLDGFINPPSFPSILGHIFVWILAGMLIRSWDPKDDPKRLAHMILGGSVGWLALALLWILPVWFPALQLNDYGFRLDLRDSPLVLWVAVAFSLGYSHKSALQIPNVIWKQTQKNWLNKEEGFGKYRLSMLFRGLGQLLGIHRS